MDIPRGHAMLPLNESDFLDFIYNYFKAEYSPIRSIWATATAEPRQSSRWMSMGHELTPFTFRPANAQAQKDLESLDYFTRVKNLDAGFVRGLVVRFAKYEVHERLEKKLYESARLDLMVRKALKEKHLIDALWPSPAPRETKQELLRQGVQVRSWYGDMFSKYFRVLHSLDDFSLRPEVDAKIKGSGTLMLVPFVDHLVFGNVDPIMPIVAKGAGYANSQAWKQKSKAGSGSFGDPDLFEIRFDAPSEIEDTQTKSVVRQCQCLKCGTKRDVQVKIIIDPSPGPTARKASISNTSASRRRPPKTTQRYSPGYAMPGSTESANSNSAAHSPPSQPQPHSSETTDSSSSKMKACPKCTFLNHPELTSCEICGSDLPDTLVTKAPSPVTTPNKPSHSHSASLPPTKKPETKDHPRPTGPNRHSLSSTLFSIFPFSQQHQSEHHANLPSTQPQKQSQPQHKPEMQQNAPTNASTSRPKSRDLSQEQQRPSSSSKYTQQEPSPPHIKLSEPHTPRIHHPSPPSEEEPSTPPLSQEPQMAMMPLTPPPPTSPAYMHPSGMPQTLTDYDFVTASPSFAKDEEEELEHSGWGEVRVEEARRRDRDGNEDDDEDEDEDERREGLIDLDAVAREEMGAWGDRDDDR